MRVDIFGVREGGEIDGTLIAPLRPTCRPCEPGEKYLLETVIRTLKMGHLFTQGTVDSNEVWLDVTVTQRRSGDRPQRGSRSREAERSRSRGRTLSTSSCWTRTATASIAAMLRTSSLRSTTTRSRPVPGRPCIMDWSCPMICDAPVTVEVKLQYRKFDQRYMDIVDEVE